MIIAVIAQKGGVGKSTLAINLACSLSRDGEKTLLIDADKQGTSAGWYRMASPELGVTVIEMPSINIHSKIEKVSKGYDHVVIDTPANTGGIPKSAAAAADMILIPATPSAVDFWAVEESIKIFQEENSSRGTLGGFVINMADRTKLCKAAIKAARDMGVPLLKTTLGRRVDFRTASGCGESVATWNGDAGREIRNLTAELEELWTR